MHIFDRTLVCHTMPYNNAMSHLQIILPFSIPPAALTADLLRELKTPALAKLIAHSKRGQIRVVDDFSRLLPHESLLSGQSSINSKLECAAPISDLQQNRLNSPAITHNKMQQFGLTPTEGFWFTLSPVHIHIARDHLVLTDQRKLDISDNEAHALFDAAKILCNEVGMNLLYGDEKNWFLRADQWHELQTSTLDAACGHNIDIWMPKGEFGLPWRKLQNEIQMSWFIHAVNTKREERGDNRLNSLWLHSGSSSLASTPPVHDATETLEQIIQKLKQQEMLCLNLDALLAPALNNDWPAWLDAIHRLETEWFAPLLQALSDKRIPSLSLIVTDARTVTDFRLTPRSFWKFWTPASLDKLFSISPPAPYDQT
jgi:hypothetical protein